MARADVEMRRVRVADDVAAVRRQEAVLPVLHGPVLMRAVVEPDEDLIAQAHHAQLVIEVTPQHAARAAVGDVRQRAETLLAHREITRPAPISERR